MPPAWAHDDSGLHPLRHAADGAAVTAADPIPTLRLETGLYAAGVVLRGAAYALLATFASRYDCGQALLGGLLVGDLAAAALALAWRNLDAWRLALAEFAVLALVFCWVRTQLVWPDDPAQRAILGLAAFGVFAGRAGSTAWTRLGPSENGWD